MNYAVILASDEPALVGMPANWPVRVQPIGDAQTLPAPYAPPWKHYTKEQLEQLKTSLAAVKEAWDITQGEAETAPKRNRDALIRQSKADLTAIIDTSGTLTGVQLSNAVRSMARTLRALLEDLGY